MDRGFKMAGVCLGSGNETSSVQKCTGDDSKNATIATATRYGDANIRYCKPASKSESPCNISAEEAGYIPSMTVQSSEPSPRPRTGTSQHVEKPMVGNKASISSKEGMDHSGGIVSENSVRSSGNNSEKPILQRCRSSSMGENNTGTTTGGGKTVSQTGDDLVDFDGSRPPSRRGLSSSTCVRFNTLPRETRTSHRSPALASNSFRRPPNRSQSRGLRLSNLSEGSLTQTETAAPTASSELLRRTERATPILKLSVHPTTGAVSRTLDNTSKNRIPNDASN